jgi:hypothetical protein
MVLILTIKGAEFGRLVAGSLLSKFIDTFKFTRESSNVMNVSKFQTFQTKISEALEDAVTVLLKKGNGATPKQATHSRHCWHRDGLGVGSIDGWCVVLDAVKSQRGIRVAALVWNDDNIKVEGQLEDRIGMVANLQALVTFSNAISMSCHAIMSTIASPTDWLRCLVAV